ncbi:MAG TPA: ABC transporter substrate-binding protein, partial [Alphaproteobacteria bacterium]|nr:ABC transporter substrate-binding protein [Alphaproteobacteria bacterium]
MDKLNTLERLFGQGRISRRDFMSQALALGATTALATSLASRALAATPKKGGHFRFGSAHGSTTDSINPATFENAFSQFLGYGIRNHLMEVDNTGKLVPELAAGYDVSDDATTWAFKLRKGVEFHNGKTMDSGDVVASINHHRGKDSKSAAKKLLEPIVELKADGKDTVVIKLKAGNADFPYIMSDYHIAIMPAMGEGVDFKSGVGTGAFVLENFEPGVRAKMKRNPNYFKSGYGNFDSAEMIS